MTLHRLAQITMGVPNVSETVAYYAEFGLRHDGGGVLSSAEGGRQLHVVPSHRRRLVSMQVGVDSPDDIARAARSLSDRGYAITAHDAGLTVVDPVSEVAVALDVMPRLAQAAVPAPAYNGPARYDRAGTRAPGVLREGPVRPLKLGHVVVGTVDMAATRRLFADGLGFKVSDAIGDKGVFLRCSTDHHNIMLLQMPVNFLHHSSWQVEDIDDVGRGAQRMLENNPGRHVWGLGRHHAGSNFFWYLKDPAGNFSEYYSDMDYIPEDQAWTPEVLEGAKGLFSWGPPPPPSFLAPEDLADLMTSAHN
jgi:catechol 2,3-dioxygenase-like lactoylglutathione lyase family enzyme